MHTFKTLLSYRGLGCVDVCAFAYMVEDLNHTCKDHKAMIRYRFSFSVFRVEHRMNRKYEMITMMTALMSSL